MLLLEATKLPADPKFSEFKPSHGTGSSRNKFKKSSVVLVQFTYYTSLERNILHQSVFQVPFSRVVNLLKIFCMFLQCILQSAFYTHRMLNTIFQRSARWKKLNLFFLKYVKCAFVGRTNNAPKLCLNCAKLLSMCANSGDVHHG